MKRKNLLVATLAALIIFLLFPFMNYFSGKQDDFSFGVNESQSIQDHIWAKEILDSLTLYEKCAQMIMPRAGSEMPQLYKEKLNSVIELVEKYKFGGFVFFKGNTTEQTEIVKQIQSKSKIPLLIAADYERGLGMRLKDAVEFPSSMAIAAANEPSLSYRMGLLIARESRIIGVHQNFAPILDVNTDFRNPVINTRAFSDDPYTVAKHSIAFINGMNEGKMVATPKHFPGHGATEFDSHNQLPVIQQSFSMLGKTDLFPYEKAIASNVRAIMIGHLAVPAFRTKANLPATLSAEAINGMLFNELKFQGVVVTDAMNMKSISDNFPDGEAVKHAVLAGNDIILYPKSPVVTLDALYKYASTGEIPVERINKSVEKILLLKKWLGMDKKTKDTEDESLVAELKNEQKELAKEIAEKSITLVNDEKNLVPIDHSLYKKPLMIAIASKPQNETPLFYEKMKSIYGSENSFFLIPESKKEEFTAVQKKIKSADFILVAIFTNEIEIKLKAPSSKKMFFSELLKLKKPIVVMNFGNPYLISNYPDIKSYICSYGWPEASQIAMFNAINGTSDITGKLPIGLTSTKFTSGSGVISYRKQLSSNQSYNFRSLDSLMEISIKDKIFPGGVLLVSHKGEDVFHKAFGNFTYDKTSNAMSTSTIFDLASVTKVAATTMAAMKLVGEGKLNTDDKVVKYLPEFKSFGKDTIRIRNLLMHNSGLPEWKPLFKNYKNSADAWKDIISTQPLFPAGQKYLYSDLGMITLQKVIEKIIKNPINIFLEKEIYLKLGMQHTFFNPDKKFKEICPPTEIDNEWRKRVIQGEVHDENASLFNGVAGHAGLFSTTKNLSVLLNVLLSDGFFGHEKIFDENLINDWTSLKCIDGNRGYGWGISEFDAIRKGVAEKHKLFGHTGFTGTCIWVNKSEKLFFILLTNRTYPDRKSAKIGEVRKAVYKLATKELFK